VRHVSSRTWLDVPAVGHRPFKSRSGGDRNRCLCPGVPGTPFS
jgi:hypothetical protein